MTEYTASTFDDRIAARYDEIYEHLPDAGPAAGALARLAGNGRGRLRQKPGGRDIPVTIGDFADFSLDARYDLVFVVFNTFFDLPSQDAQVRCFATVARHLTVGGVFVIQAFVPDHARLARGKEVSAEAYGDLLRVDVSRFDTIEQRVDARHVLIGESGIEQFPVRLRYAWPAELDLMARLAGLRLKERWADWAGNPFTSSSTGHVSVYEQS